MEYYVIRVYRRDAAGNIVGFIEDIATGRRSPFRNQDSLWRALTQPEGQEERCVVPTTKIDLDEV